MSSNMRLRQFTVLLFHSFFDWQRHRCSAWGAALAFYALVSSAPFLVSLYLLAVTIFDRQTVLSKIVPHVRDRLGQKGVEFIEFLAKNFSTEASWTGAMAIFGYLMMGWGALLYFRHLREALEVVWGQPHAKPGLIAAIKQKVIGALLALVCAQVYLASLWIRVILEIPSKAPETPLHLLLGSGDLFVFFILQIVIATVVYRFVAPERVIGRALLVGAIATAMLQTLARLVGGYVLAHEDLTSLSGLTGGFIMLMIWMNFTNQVFLYGAEVTHNWMIRCQVGDDGNHRGANIKKKTT